MAKIPTLLEFLDGSPLPYRGFKRTAMSATVQKAGVLLVHAKPPRGAKPEVAEVRDKRALTALYHNLTRIGPAKAGVK